jgi:hypothetical protein
MGAQNSVFYQAETLVPLARLPVEPGNLYAGGRVAVWRPARPGDALRLRVPVARAGPYLVHFVVRLDGSGGTVRVRWDGQPARLESGDSTLSTYLEYRTVLRDVVLRPLQLAAGPHTLQLVFDGAPPDAGRPAIGIDFVWVQEIR